MVVQTEHRFLSAVPIGPGTSASTYMPAEEVVEPLTSREVLRQYPYLRGLGIGWLDRYDEAALEEADAFVISPVDGIDAERAGHDLAVYLCDWVVANTDVARWLLRPEGACTVVLPSGNELDPYRHVVQCLTDRQPVARRFAEKAKELASEI